MPAGSTVGCQVLVLDDPDDLLAQLARLSRVGLHRRADHQALELGRRRTGAEGAPGEVKLAVDERLRLARDEVKPTVYKPVEG